MKKFTVLLISILLLSSFSFSQKKDPTKFGVQFSPFISSNEFPYERRIRTSWVGRVLLRFGFEENLTGEFGGGYGQYTGNDLYYDYYKTTIIPVDFRLLLKFTKDASFPYAFAGIGGMYYDVVNLPQLSPSPNPDIKENGVAGLGSAGLGYEIKLSESVAMDLNIGATITTTDNLNYYKDGDAPDGYYFASLGFLFGGGPTDNDMDGLMSDKEEELGTDPENPDTDGDGLKDGEEVSKYTTDPKNRDTDGEGLTDGDEVTKYQSSPLKADTDGEGLNDREEIIDYKTNPLKADTDGDTLSDADEVKKYKTDPLKTDTDMDSLSDGDEVNTYKTNPLKSDTDDDLLKDNDELKTYKTDPLKGDTDGGSVSDGKEVNRGTDPLNAEDDVMKVGKSIVLAGITFKTGSAEITPESAATLEKALRTLKDNPDVTVEVSGHTDNVGSDASNKKLSQKRADAVKKWMVDNGIPADRLVAVGYGESKPIAPNDTPENKQKNRRIEFVRLK